MGYHIHKSDLRNHQLEAIVQPRFKLYDCFKLMAAQITLKTERFHGFPSDRLPAEVDPQRTKTATYLHEDSPN